MKTNFIKSIAFVLFAVVSVGLASCCKDKPEIVSDPDTSETIKTHTSGMHVSKYSVRNGETISLTTDISGTNNGKDISFTVTYFCDGNKIGTSTDSTNKYHVDYHVNGLSLGTHALKSRAIYESVKNEYNVSINVIE